MEMLTNNPINTILKRDNLILGVVLGLLTPVVGMLLYYALAFAPKGISFTEFFRLLGANRFLLPKFISISLLLNGVVFYLYTRKRRDVTAKGIFLVTMLYAIVILLLKLIF
ncbi:hypothetical protein MKQ70_22495 [Chitinophaga sedimenti]|uniref:hypothetical protein n=1 Tax=Chitinophaga sedimenti TaxID=2033606 RepID=UPI002005DCE5|nr:hypothetical protein [Chitinophaga sedimenti]MCK7557624.1 hypothetical protein [Chitinophaga sedimenti]